MLMQCSLLKRSAASTSRAARNVTLGESYGNSVAVNSGVKPGEIVITTGVTQVADGEEVRVTQTNRVQLGPKDL